ncbi:hypothetical protein MTO96_032957, partial [Rhipicephalus appendiculatus]
KPSALFDETNPDWAPSLRLGYGSKHTGAARHERATKRRHDKRQAEFERHRRQGEAAIVDPAAEPASQTCAAADAPSSPQPVEDTDEAETGVSVQTDMTASNIEASEKECVHLNQYIYTARVKMELLEMTEEMLRRCEPKVIYYTGLSSFNTLQAVFKLLERYVPHGVNNSLTKFQEFVIFMMKMKLCLPNADIAFRFNVSEATVSRIFDRWLHVAYSRLGPTITWPERAALQRTMPQAFFDAFDANVAVIIDCFEIKVERPSSFLARSETWSTYKGSNTAKFLIGIAPQGGSDVYF